MATSYSIFPSLLTLSEGQTLQTLVQTTGVADGTTLYWLLGGTNITANDLSSGALTGQGRVVADASGSGTFSFSHTLRNDLITEGPETLQIKLFTNAARTLQVGSTALVTILDTSLTQPRTYSITPSAAAVNEGLAVLTTVKTTNVPAGTVLYWALSGSGITAADYIVGGLSGSAAVPANGQFSFSRTLANDKATEGPETVEIRLFSDAARTAQVGATASYVINDTSTASTRTYAITPSAAAVNEGQAVTTTVRTTNVPAGTVLYWAFSGSGITAADFSAGALSGSAAVPANGLFSFNHTLANDKTTEGPETVQIKLFSNAARTVQVGATASYIVKDTSFAPIPTFTITPSVTNIDEGLELITTVKSTNVSPGTRLYWQLSGTGISAADFQPSVLNGAGAVDANGQFAFTNSIASDFLTEGPETLLIKLFSDPAFTTQVGNTASVVINDTFNTPKPVSPKATFMVMPSVRVINEGLVLTTMVHTGNVAPGTPLFWDLSGSGITDADFSNGFISGSSVTAANGMFSFSHTIANDLITEGDENLQIKLYTDAAHNQSGWHHYDRLNQRHLQDPGPGTGAQLFDQHLGDFPGRRSGADHHRRYRQCGKRYTGVLDPERSRYHQPGFQCWHRDRFSHDRQRWPVQVEPCRGS